LAPRTFADIRPAPFKKDLCSNEQSLCSHPGDAYGSSLDWNTCLSGQAVEPRSRSEVTISGDMYRNVIWQPKSKVSGWI